MSQLLPTVDRTITIELTSMTWQLLQVYPFPLFLIIVLIRFLYRKLASPLRHLPGPLTASGSHVWKVWSTFQGHTEQDHIDLHRLYGDIVRIGPNELSFASPEAARNILAPANGFCKTDFYAAFPPASNPDIFTEIREELHSVKKRLVSPAFSMTSFQQLTPWIEQTQQHLISRIDESVEYGGLWHSLDLGLWLHFFACDVLGEVGFGRSFGFLREGRDVNRTIQTINESIAYNGVVGQVPWWNKVFHQNSIYRILPWLTCDNVLVTKVALKEIQDRKAGKTVVDRKDLLCQLLEICEKNNEKFSDGDVFAIAHGAIIAGSDSTASTMQTLLYNILSDLRVYSRLTSEILNAHTSGLLSPVIQYDEAVGSLPYFQACLKEAMRIGPAVGFDMCRYAPAAGIELGGKWIPGGTRCAVNAWVIHRDKDVFGEDAEQYRPERWDISDGEESTKTRVKRMERNMLQFGGGSHVCIGRHLALLEINKIIPQLLRRYHFELIHPDRPMKTRTTFFVVQEGLDVRVTRRVRPCGRFLVD